MTNDEFVDWEPEQIVYLLEELAEGHWNDRGNKMDGFAAAFAGCRIAHAFDAYGDTKQAVDIALENIWLIADYLSGGLWWGQDEPGEGYSASELQRMEDTLKTITDATLWIKYRAEDLGSEPGVVAPRPSAVSSLHGYSLN